MDKNLTEELKICAKELNVLVVEDDKDLNELLTNMLKMFYKSVESAYDGKDGLEKYVNGNYDIIVSDINMPNMNGVEMAKEIKKFNRDQVIIVLSAHNEPHFLIDLIETGVDGFSQKPFNPAAFIPTIHRESKHIIQRRELERLKFKSFQRKIEQAKKSKDIQKQNSPTKVRPASKDDIIAEQEAEEQMLRDMERELELDIKQSKQATATLDHLNEDHNLFEELAPDVEKMIALNEEFQNLIEEMLLNGLNDSVLKDIGEILAKYYAVLSKSSKLDDVSKHFAELSEIFSETNYDDLGPEAKSALSNIEYIADDIKNFITDVFLTKRVTNITFLEKALIGYHDQVNLELGLVDAQEIDFF
jgi:DNA-binding response OmpR family regulator